MKSDSEEFKLGRSFRNIINHLLILFYVYTRGIHDKNIFNSQRNSSINIIVLSIMILNEDFISSIFFFIVDKTVECLTIHGILDLMKYITKMVVGIIRGPEEYQWP